VTAVEVEFPLPVDAECSATKLTNPRLYFRNDFSGYGWCVRKCNYLNIGIGIVNSRQTASEVPQFLSELSREAAYTDEIPSRFRGHAYHLYDGCRSKVFDDYILLIGDAAGLAYSQSGEGIRPAVESGLLAAQVIVEADGQFDKLKLQRYRERITARLGSPPKWQLDGSLGRLVQNFRSSIGRHLFKSSRFVRDVVIRESFLRSDQPPLIV
jgi:flavin-dependent dehydrogenase